MSLPEAEPGVVPELPAPTTNPDEFRSGMAAALAAYLLWGFLPLLFRLLDGVPAPLIVAERTVWSLLIIGAVLYAGRLFGEVRAILADWRKLRLMAVSAVLLGGNWLLYVWAVETEQVLEASFGYFINPLVSVAIGMVLFGERQSRWQGIAIALACLAIVLQAVGLGGVPMIALGLALSFGFYGYFRKTATVGSTTGLFVETLLLLPVGLLYIGYVTATGGPGPHADPWLFFLLVMTGPATAVPLLLFSHGVRRLRLTTIGMLQYIAPSIQFLIAVFLFGEELGALRLLSFVLIWASLVMFSADSLRQRREARAAQ